VCHNTVPHNVVNPTLYVVKIVLIIANINKDENKSLISNQFSLENDFPPPPLLGELFYMVFFTYFTIYGVIISGLY
jgi:hypothetical protein